MDGSIFLFFPLFLFAVFIAFYLPGNIFISTHRLTKLQKVTLSISFGIVLWALQGFLFGYLYARWLTYIYLLLSLGIWIFKNRNNFQFTKFKFVYPKSRDILLGAFIVFAVFTQLITTFANGFTTSNGIYFCCGLPDTFYHIALTNELVTNFPPHEPGLSGVLLKNYHFLPNLVNADLIRIFHIPLLYLQYPYTSLLITLLLALNIVAFSQLILKNRFYTYWLLFFVFFSGDLLYILTFIKYHNLNFNTAFLENASWLWISPPRVYGATLLFAGISFLFLWIKDKKNIILDILVAVTFGSLIGFKVYFGIFALVGLAALSLIYFKEKNKRKIVVVFMAFLLSLMLYLPINSGAGGFVFTGFWRFNDFAANSVFGLQRMELARYVYLAHGNWTHALLNSLIYFFLYILFIFGTLLVSLFQTKNSLRLFGKELNTFLISGLVICFILGSFFIQKTGGANSSQFLITDMIILSIYTALAIFYWSQKWNKRKMSIIFISFLIIIFTIPRVLYEDITTLWRINNNLKGITIDNNQLNALTYLRNNTPKNSVVLHYNTQDCLYLTFLAQRQTYICLDGAPGDRGVVTDKRIKLQKSIFTNNDKYSLATVSQNRTVGYLYMPTNIYLLRKKLYQKFQYKKIYSNEEVTILQVF